MNSLLNFLKNNSGIASSPRAIKGASTSDHDFEEIIEEVESEFGEDLESEFCEDNNSESQCRVCHWVSSLSSFFDLNSGKEQFSLFVPGNQHLSKNKSFRTVTHSSVSEESNYRGRLSSYPPNASSLALAPGRIRAKMNKENFFRDLWVDNNLLYMMKTSTLENPNIAIDNVSLSHVIQVMKYPGKCKMTVYVQEPNSQMVFINLEFERMQALQDLFHCMEQVLKHTGQTFVAAKK